MKGDFTRSTFKKEKHYHSVHIQQGRVQTDADWNEQQGIIINRTESGTEDIVGPCGAPMHHDGFQLVANISDLPPEIQNRPENQSPPSLADSEDFFITAGHYYVHGIQSINEQITTWKKQIHKPLIKPPPADGKYLAYVDVWQRHLTALEDPDIREVALGGADTATRTQNIWQVKLYNLETMGNVNCLSDFSDWRDFVNPVKGTLAAQVKETTT